MVWSDDKVNKKFIVAENFTQLVAKGKQFCLYSFIYFISAWRDRMLHATSDLTDLKLLCLLFLLAIVFVCIYYSLD